MSGCDTEVLLVSRQDVLLRNEPVCEVVMIENGAPGRPGPPGQGGSTYTHTQSAPAAVWTVAHNLARRPSVTVVDHLGNTLIADVLYVNDNIVQVTHSVALIGAAYCN